MAPRRRLLLPRRDLPTAAVVWAGLAIYVVVVYVLVVLGGGLLIGQTDAPNVVLSVLATAVVAVGFGPMQSRIERLARHLTGAASSPYEVLGRFSERVGTAEGIEDLPDRMARLLAEATRARWTQVWLVVAGSPRLAACWPTSDAGDPTPPNLSWAIPEANSSPQRALLVRHGGQALAVLRLRENERRPLTPVEARLFAGLAAHAGLVLRTTALRAELSQRLTELSAREAELRSSRERLVETQDDERRKLERDIHDGAQQHLVALAVNLRLAQTLVARSSSRADQVLADQSEAALEAIATLSQLSRGIYPAVLAEEGLAPALRSATAVSPIRVQVIDEPLPRLPVASEAALYFCCLEALQNVAKHSGAQRATVRLSSPDRGIAVTIDDDGIGFDPSTAGSGTGLANMRDRIDAIHGELAVTAAPGAGCHIELRVPASAVGSRGQAVGVG
jgi:signal transduction histidine kinase